MAKQVKQFRFYQSGSAKNYPTSITSRLLINGKAFEDYVPIIQLGVQGLPGTQFYLNGSNNPIIIGNTGIYELDLLGIAEITALKFDSRSIAAIEGNNNSFLIVDIIYEDGET